MQHQHRRLRPRKSLSLQTMLVGALVTVAVLAGRAGADEAASPARVSALLDSAAKVLADAQQLEVTIEFRQAVALEGVEQKRSERSLLRIARPQRAALLPLAGGPLEIVCDGAQGRVRRSAGNEYMAAAAAADLSTILAEGSFPAQYLAEAAPFVPSLLVGSFEMFTAEGAQVTYIESSHNPAPREHHLRVSAGADQPDLDMWFSDGERPLLTRMSVDVGAFYSGQPGLSNLEYLLEWRLSDWRLDPSGGALAFEIPVDGAARQTPYFGAPEMVGQAAPDFEMTFLNGKTTSVADHRGKQVVVLDFWAIRCPPCRQALPKYAELAAKYRDQGVVIYAVNGEDSSSRITDYLKQANIDIVAVRDPSQRGFELYGVAGIPHTVVVGKNGYVQAIHSGFDGGEQLDKELAQLAAGKPLVASTGSQPTRRMDLALKDVTFSPEPSVGGDSTISFVITNKSGADVPPGGYLLVAAVGHAEFMQYVANGPVAIPAGKTVTVTVPAEQLQFSWREAQRHTCRALVHQAGLYVDANEMNNQKFMLVTVAPAAK